MQRNPVASQWRTFDAAAVTSYWRDRLACFAARARGTCTNHLTISRQEFEERVLVALRDELMRRDRFADFCKEYVRELNRLSMEHRAIAWSARTQRHRRCRSCCLRGGGRLQIELVAGARLNLHCRSVPVNNAGATCRTLRASPGKRAATTQRPRGKLVARNVRVRGACRKLNPRSALAESVRRADFLDICKLRSVPRKELRATARSSNQ